MKRHFIDRALGVVEDVASSLRGCGPPLGKVFDREYVAAWRQFHEFAPAGVKVLMDVGAHEGLYGRRAALYFQLDRTIFVEPLPDYASHLRTLGLPGMKVVEAALSDRVGTAQFTISQTAQASSLLEMNPEMSAAYNLDLADHHKIEVKVTTLDDLCGQEGIDRIDLLKIDVQGAERSLLAGAESILRRTRFIQIEVLFVEHYKDCALFFEIDQICRKAGFDLCRLVDFSYSSEGRLLQADAIYENRERRHGV